MPHRYYPWLAPLAVCTLFAAAVLPSLSRLEFLDGVEHFNLATVQEMRRNEAAGLPTNWMLPSLQGDARVVKPPWTAWITAILISPGRAAALSTPDDASRAKAWEAFVLLARLPSVACACLMLLGVYWMGRTLSAGDWRVGSVAALICAGTALFFYQARRATTDLQLALWVTWTNVMLSVALFTTRRWLGWCGAGFMLGLASMAKGPHIALLMTVVPTTLYAMFARPQRPAANANEIKTLHTAPSVSRYLPPMAGALIAVGVGLWWYGYVAATVPGIGDIWWREVTRKDAAIGRGTLMPDDPWYAYLMILMVLLPWTPWILLAGLWVVLACMSSLLTGSRSAGNGARTWLIARGQLAWLHDVRRQLLPLLWLVFPILVMSFFAEKKERYLVPFAGPAAVLAGWAMVRWWDARERKGVATFDHIASAVAVVASTLSAGWLSIGVAIAGGIGWKGYRSIDDRPWFPADLALLAGGSIFFLLILGLVRSRRNVLSPLLAITVAAWIGAELRMRGHMVGAGDPDDRPQRELADEIWRRWPDARVFCTEPVTLYGQLNKAAIVVSMQLNRVIETRPEILPAQPVANPMILLTDRVDEVPAIPPGWRRAYQVPLRKGIRYVDVLAKE